MIMTDEVAIDTEVMPDLVEEKQQEKTLPISRVEELVKKAKLKGRDSVQAELDALKAENENLRSNAGSMGGMAAPVDLDSLKQQVLQDLKNQFQEASEQRANEDLQKEAKRIADEYHSRMSSGKESFEDFDDVMADFNPAAFPNLVYLVSQVENTPAVMYELMTNPSKWATIAMLSERDPQAAQNRLNRMSASIKANEQAKAQEKDVPNPLSRMSSSITGQDTGELSIKDYKKMFRG